MLAATADPRVGLPRDGARWAYEVKWDGMRVLADLRDGAVRLSSRAGNEVTTAWPELAAIGEVHPDVLLDGEVVVLRRGVPSFGALAERMHVRDRRRAAAYAASAPATFIAFDVLRLYGVDLTGRTWQERREVLERLPPSGRAWQLSPVYDDAEVLLAATLEQGLEGVVAKRRASRYAPGGRNGDWVKLPHHRVQACVVGGWRPETDDPRRIGSLLLGVWDLGGEPGAAAAGGAAAGGAAARRLRFVGKVGSGLATASQVGVVAALAPHGRATSPFGTEVPRAEAAGAHWLEPRVVVEVRYLGRSEAGRLRQPVFRGLRTDLDPDEVAEEA
jgi:bifunctional non-homologous end joining protein LigD